MYIMFRSMEKMFKKLLFFLKSIKFSVSAHKCVQLNFSHIVNAIKMHNFGKHCCIHACADKIYSIYASGKWSKMPKSS